MDLTLTLTHEMTSALAVAIAQLEIYCHLVESVQKCTF